MSFVTTDDSVWRTIGSDLDLVRLWVYQNILDDRKNFNLKKGNRDQK